VHEAVRLEEVTVCYRRPHERIWSLKEYAIRRFQRRVVFDDFLALQNVNLSIGAGETVGIVGRNGAGKSTLLRVIARVISPAFGKVVVEGRLAPILELGLGLHSELTGRENVLLQGALLGFSRAHMKRRLTDIVAFAELEDVIDAPVRTYSTGMTARLAFAVATDVDPDILLIDEVLAVGDEGFQKKSKKRMESFRAAGKTVIIVSHNLKQISDLCPRAIWIESGALMCDGDAPSVVQAYVDSLVAPAS
jgi:homopolymeric O-antigen transport system ATP-binding protein